MDNLNRDDLGGDIHTENPGEEIVLFLYFTFSLLYSNNEK